MKIPFKLPIPIGAAQAPEWDGSTFIIDGKTTPVLEYSENSAGWSDELSLMHEEALGGSHPMDIASRQDALDQIKKSMPSSDAVIMEIGCSSGYFIKDLKSSFPSAVVIGVDVVKAPLYQLAKDLPGVPLIRFDLLQCPLASQTVDVLVMLNVLEHLEDDQKALHKAFDLLKPGGILITEVPAYPMLYGAYDQELRHFRRYAPADFYRKLKQAGFSIKRKTYLGFILFPAFALVKLLDKWLRPSRKKVVRQQAGSTAHNPLVKWAMGVESKYLSRIQLPFGIRILAVAQKELLKV